MTVNSIQHGGDHYKGTYQHWDLVADMGLNYYMACASKYVTRHRKKNGREDVLKAIHYVQKYLELIRDGNLAPPVYRTGSMQAGMYSMATEFFSANGIQIGSHEYTALIGVLMPRCVSDVSDALHPLGALLAEYDAADPSPAYVNQG